MQCGSSAALSVKIVHPHIENFISTCDDRMIAGNLQFQCSPETPHVSLISFDLIAPPSVLRGYLKYQQKHSDPSIISPFPTIVYFSGCYIRSQYQQAKFLDYGKMTEASSFENFVFMNDGENPYGPSPSDSEDTAEADMASMMGFSNFGSKPKPTSKKRKREMAQLAASGPGAESGSGSNTMPLGKPRRKPVEGENVAEASEGKEGAVLGSEGTMDQGSHKQWQLSGQLEDAVHDPPLAEQREPSPSTKGYSPIAGGSDQTRYDWYALRKGVRDQNGDVAYYDVSFVEDPWKGLS